jgi:predicted nucleic acid-binding protein
MVLVDTSIWIEHFRRTEPGLASLLNHGMVACHPFIIGELAAGNLRNRAEILGLFRVLPSVPVVESEEYLEFVDARKLMGKGLSFIDIHLLASAVLGGVPIWTADRRLAAIARVLGVGFGG